ncbi:hypothetical protein [uncultured Aquimarina sp.]|uniref:hypothetical protein n=1 Tax=uncultured Aquimarina sp. TaxID=575652 RepID=UPI00262E69EF|nr:hypothetical protein [uncultured Aquimarina sp.]
MKTIQKIILVLSIILASCENESFDILNEKIDVNSELFSNLKTLSETAPENAEVVCLTFIYPFNVYLYDENEAISDSQIINNNIEFTQLLGQIPEENSISLSYPISGTTADGNSISINSNFGLKEAIGACIDDQIILYCNNLLEEPNCVWEIESQTENDQYDNSLLDFYDDGTGVFYHNGNAYRVSWISLFIEEQLHVNIRVEGDSSVAEDWNFDWEAEIINENTIKITNQEDSFIIEKNCNIENNCDYVEFRECESDNEEETQFVFDNYIDCITSFREETEIPNLELTFYSTMDDATQQINQLPTNGYNNVANPQIIFVLINNTITEVSQISRIVLLEETCSDNK